MQNVLPDVRIVGPSHEAYKGLEQTEPPPTVHFVEKVDVVSDEEELEYEEDDQEEEELLAFSSAGFV